MNGMNAVNVFECVLLSLACCAPGIVRIVCNAAGGIIAVGAEPEIWHYGDGEVDGARILHTANVNE